MAVRNKLLVTCKKFSSTIHIYNVTEPGSFLDLQNLYLVSPAPRESLVTTDLKNSQAYTCV